MRADGNDAVDLLGLGAHCALAECRQLDFLPFKCSGCGRTFCLDHRQASAHACPTPPQPASDDGGGEVIVCPLCAGGVRLPRGADPNAVFDAHTRSGDCDPARYARVVKKPRCAARGCKERLATVNAYDCRVCGQRVCLRHRHGDDHGCAEAASAAAAAARGSTATRRAAAAAGGAAAAAAAAAASAGARLRSGASSLVDRVAGAAAAATNGSSNSSRNRNHTNNTWAGVNAAAPPAPAAAAAPDPANSLRGTAERRRQVLGLPSTGAAAGQATAAERCPQCGAAFANVGELIAHAEAAHGGGGGSQAEGSGVSAAAFACPRCGRGFADPVLLVAHSDRCGGGNDGGGGGAGRQPASDSTCVLF